MSMLSAQMLTDYENRLYHLLVVYAIAMKKAMGKTLNFGKRNPEKICKKIERRGILTP